MIYLVSCRCCRSILSVRDGDTIVLCDACGRTWKVRRNPETGLWETLP